jgi:hypothetical protein
MSGSLGKINLPDCTMVRDFFSYTKFDVVRQPMNSLYSSAQTTSTIQPGGELKYVRY